MEAFPVDTVETPSVVEDPALGLSRRTKIEILGAILLGMFLAALDQTIVGPVLPRIVTELRGNDYYTWVVTIYLLTSTVTVPIYGKLSDLYGRKPLLLIGVTLFLVGSALSGLSQTMWQLILFRGIQGLGAGSMFPIALAVIGDMFTPAERGKYQGLFGAVFGIAFLVGPGLGGYLTDNFSWHWVFFVNLPIGIIALAVIQQLLPNIRKAGKQVNIDYLGVITIAAGLVPILIGLTIAENGNWADPYVWGWIGAGAVFLIVFVAIERRAVEPIIPLHLFRSRTFSASMVAIFLATFGFGAAIIFLPLYFQVVEGSSATQSGYKLLPFLFGLIFSSIIAGQVVSRTGRYKAVVVIGTVILAVGLALMTQLRVGTADITLWTWMFIAGLGVGPTFAVFTIIVQNSVPFHELGAATSDLTLFRQIGTTVGIALAFTLFRDNLTWSLLRQEIVNAGAPSALVPATPPVGFDLGQLTSVGSGNSGLQFLHQIPAQFQPIFLNGFHSAFTLAIGQSMWLGVGAAALAVLATLFLREIPLRQTLGPQTVPSRAATSETAAEPATRIPSQPAVD
ncbi:MAG TPA: MDR family MFS transporter [Candidatus Limnocylindrales bacterium]|jgi:EmrB/QacA subfamily drug resistance transporter